MPIRVLIVEDDPELARVLQLELEQSGYEVITAVDGETGLSLFRQKQPDLAVLDVSLPGELDGFAVCQRIRALSNIPILIMTAHAVTEQAIAEGLNLGADEYLLKPLGNLEFKARVNALLRRARPLLSAHVSVYNDGYLQVDLQARRVHVNRQDVRLTPTEFNLLALFLQNVNQVLSFQVILEQVWGPEYRNELHYPRIYVSHLRHKIEPDATNPTYIHNEYGTGYRFIAQTTPPSNGDA